LRLSVDGTLARHQYDFNQRVEGGETIVSGRDVDTAPRRVRNARLAWQGGSGLSAELEWQHVGHYWVDAANANAYGGHDVIDLRAGWQLSPAWRVGARVDNLTDRAYADRADYAFGSYRYFPGRGRAVFMELAWRQD
jgi:iron complex outermembrane recepter protein